VSNYAVPLPLNSLSILNTHRFTKILVAINFVNVVQNSISSYKSNADGGIGISAILNILFAPDFVDYTLDLYGSPHNRGTPKLTANLTS